jgi:hypothetical protein
LLHTYCLAYQKMTGIHFFDPPNSAEKISAGSGYLLGSRLAAGGAALPLFRGVRAQRFSLFSKKLLNRGEAAPCRRQNFNFYPLPADKNWAGFAGL